MVNIDDKGKDREHNITKLKHESNLKKSIDKKELKEEKSSAKEKEKEDKHDKKNLACNEWIKKELSDDDRTRAQVLKNDEKQVESDDKIKDYFEKMIT